MRAHLLVALASLTVVAGCSRMSPEERWANGEAARLQRNHDLALEHYRAILADHPASAQAEPAAYAIATIYNNELRDFPNAVEAYKMYLREFPHAESAPVARFMVAFVYHNELKQLDSAAVWFRSFLEKHPEHEMAPSAQFELQNLGRSPDDLIPRDSAAGAPVSAVAGGR